MLKTSSFALMHFLIAFCVTYLLTGDLMVGGLVAVIEPAINTVGYFFHEKFWQRRQQHGHLPVNQTVLQPSSR